MRNASLERVYSVSLRRGTQSLNIINLRVSSINLSESFGKTESRCQCLSGPPVSPPTPFA